MKQQVSVLLVCLALVGCRPSAVSLTPKARPGGNTFVYLHPLPQEAERLRFRLDGLVAQAEDGSTVPLTVVRPEAIGSGEPRERLLAVGELPVGRYTGLEVRVSAATLEGREGPSALRLPEEPTRIDVHFDVSRRRAVVLSMKFAYRDSIREGFRFSPVFTAATPGQVAFGLIGLSTSSESETVTLFDKLTGTVVGVIPTGRGPAGLAVDEERRRAYVALAGDDGIEALDLLQNFVLARLQLNGGDRPREIALTPDGRKLLVADSGSDTVSIVDALGLVETDRVSVGTAPASVLLEPSGRNAFVFNRLSDTISVIDVDRAIVTKTLATDPEPFRGQFDRGGERLYVIHGASPYLTLINVRSLEVESRAYLGVGATALTVDPRTGWVYIARRASDRIEIYDPSSLLPIDSIRVSADVSYMAIDPEGNNLYLVLPEPGEIRVVQLTGKGTLTRVDVGRDPYWVSLMGER